MLAHSTSLAAVFFAIVLVAIPIDAAAGHKSGAGGLHKRGLAAKLESRQAR